MIENINITQAIDEITDLVAVLAIAGAAIYGTALGEAALAAVVSIALGKRVFKGLQPSNGQQ